LKVSSAIGTTHDTIARDYLGSPKVVKTYYPNMSKEDVENFHKELNKLVKHLDSRFGRGQYDIVTDESMLRMVGRININGQYKTIAGTMDMLVIDGNGNFHIFDFKTNRANNHTEFTAENTMIYPKQVEMYKQMLEHNNGKVESVNLIQFNVFYDTPKGKDQYETGEVEYTVSNG
jgi:ATP-dependent exoDNAse (exonuclease V) beta subunit